MAKPWSFSPKSRISSKKPPSRSTGSGHGGPRPLPARLRGGAGHGRADHPARGSPTEDGIGTGAVSSGPSASRHRSSKRCRAHPEPRSDASRIQADRVRAAPISFGETADVPGATLDSSGIVRNASGETLDALGAARHRSRVTPGASGIIPNAFGMTLNALGAALSP